MRIGARPNPAVPGSARYEQRMAIPIPQGSKVAKGDEGRVNPGPWSSTGKHGPLARLRPSKNIWGSAGQVNPCPNHHFVDNIATCSYFVPTSPEFGGYWIVRIRGR